jgi:hypothetical protein
MDRVMTRFINPESCGKTPPNTTTYGGGDDVCGAADSQDEECDHGEKFPSCEVRW